MPFDLWFSVDLGLSDICYFCVLVCSALLAWCVWQNPVPVVQQDPTISVAGETVNRCPDPEVVGVSQDPTFSSPAPEEVPTSNPFLNREPPLTYGQSTRVRDRLRSLTGDISSSSSSASGDYLLWSDSRLQDLLDVGRQQTQRP